MSGNWLDVSSTSGNRFLSTYVKGFVDVSGGNVLLRAGPSNNNHLILQGGDISLNGRLFVTKDVSMNGNVSLGGNLLVNGNLSVNQFQSTTKITTTNYQLVVAEDLSLNGRLNVTQDASMNGNVYVKGNVGIGTTAPVYPLDVTGQMRVTYNSNPSIILTGNGTDTSIGLNNTATSGRNFFVGSAGSGSAAGTGNFYIYDASANATRLVVTSSGNVGIGITSPGAPLHILSTNTGTNLCLHQLTAYGNNLIQFNTNGYDSAFIGTRGQELVINNNTGGVKLTLNATAWSSYSDIRLKTNVKNLTNGLDKIMALRPIEYNWKYIENDTVPRIGFIAQEVQDIIPEIITSSENEFLQTNALMITITDLIPFLTKAIQEQNVIVQTLQSENADLKARLAAMDARLSAVGF